MITSKLMEMIGYNIKRLRKERNYSIMDLTNMLNIGNSILSKMERGDLLPSLDFLNRMSNLFEIEITEFFKKI